MRPGQAAAQIAGMSRPVPVTVLAAPLAAILAAGADASGLSQAERQRLHGFRQLADRKRSLCAHWLKRQALARLTGVAPNALQFYDDAQGKPHLRMPGAPGFNLSHAGDWVALALGPGPVGVDVEQTRPESVWAEVLPVIGAPDDAALPGLWLWTAKEATLKCQGFGFLGDPTRIDIRTRHPAGVLAGFLARTPQGRLRGTWRAADAHHLLALACDSPSRWRVCRDAGALARALASLGPVPE